MGVLRNIFKDWRDRQKIFGGKKRRPAKRSPVMQELAGDGRRDSASGPVGLSRFVVVCERKIKGDGNDTQRRIAKKDRTRM
jgi:hypothetical protein